MKTGLVDLGSKIVYYDKDGKMVLGKEQKIDGKWYYFDKSSGAMKMGFVNLGSKIALMTSSLILVDKAFASGTV